MKYLNVPLMLHYTVHFLLWGKKCVLLFEKHERIGKDSKGSNHGLIEVISRSSPGGTEENLRKPQVSQDSQ